MKLVMSIAKNGDLPELIDLLTLYNGSFAKVVHNMDSYEPQDICDFLINRCNVYVGIADNVVEGVFIYQWMKKSGNNERVVNLHVCTMSNKFNWHEFYSDNVRPDIAQYADYQLWILEQDNKALLRLYKNYGYDFQWREDINRFICLQKL